MKRIVSVLFILLMAVSFAGCSGSSDSSDKPTDTDWFRDHVESDVRIQMMMTYEMNGLQVSITNVNRIVVEDSEVHYEANGKVNVTDKYGDKYEGKFDGEYSIPEADLENENADFKKESLEIDTPTKVESIKQAVTKFVTACLHLI